MANRKIRRRIVAEDEMPEMMDEPMESSELLFEAEDVAELVAEITGEEVEVEADEDVVKFIVGEDEFTIEPEGDEEVLEAVRRPFRNKRPVSASRNVRSRRPVRRVQASRRPVKRTR